MARGMKTSTLLIYGALGFGAWWFINNSTSGIAIQIKGELDKLLGKAGIPTTPAVPSVPATPITNPGIGLPGGPPCSPPVLAFAQNLGVPCEAVRDWVIAFGKLPDNLDSFVAWANQNGWRQPSTGNWHWGEKWWNPGKFG